MGPTQVSWLWLLPALPALGALLNATIGRRLRDEKVIAGIAIGAITAAFALGLVALGGLFSQPDRLLTQQLWTVVELRGLRIDAALAIDSLSILLVLVITGIGGLIHIYSTGYMAGHAGHWRFFAGMNLFVAAMLLLVMADNLVLLFVGWEGVGLCSWLLIGFWYEEAEKVRAANKAFIVNRLGDVGLMVGMLLLFSSAAELYGPGEATFQFRALEQRLGLLVAQPGHTQTGWITVACLLILVGAAAKSAQFPLHGWLPDAMAGPTPVSALIHAATMVTAGVYLLVRLSFLYSHSVTAMTVVACVGAATAIYAASCALMQTDLKRVLAYSTISQLGFMFLAVGVGAYWAAIFHLITHAFFKACLFLGAGAVLHQAHHQQDVRKLGGLQKVMPLTAWTYAFGALALAGLPVAGSFFSKDDILHHAFSAGRNLDAPWLGGVLWAGALAAAFGTSVYAWRSRTLVFGGAWRDEAHPAPTTDAPAQMRWVLVLLAAGAAGTTLLAMPAFEGWLEPALGPAIALAVSQRDHSGPAAAVGLIALAIGIAAAGVLLSARLWTRGPRPASMPRVIAFLGSGWWFDQVYGGIGKGNAWVANKAASFDRTVIDGIVEAVAAITRIVCMFEAAFDFYVIDGMVHLVGQISMRTGKSLRGLQSGDLMRYLYVAVAGALLVIGMQLWMG